MTSFYNFLVVLFVVDEYNEFMEVYMNMQLKDKAKGQYQEGLNYIFPQLRKEWSEYVKERILGSLRGKDVDIALHFMKALHEKTDLCAVYREELKKNPIIKDCFGKIVNVVAKFSKDGIFFYSWAMGHIYAKVTTPREEKFLSMLSRRNDIYKKENHIKENEVLV